jgi:peptide/nickel transport system ATP-binding protein
MTKNSQSQMTTGFQQRTVLEVQDLHVTLHREGQPIHALRGVDLKIERGEIVALVGESGSGKSTLGLAIQALLQAESDPIVTGSIRVGGVEVLGASKKTIRELRRKRLGAIFQDPMTSLNPSMRIGQQLEENISGEMQPERWLERVGIPNPEGRLRSYPHQLSGGQRQRVMIAIAMASNPDLVVADEPSTALDVTVQAQILRLIRRLCKEEGTTILFVTHDLSVAAAVADRIVVLYAGQVAEIGPLQELMAAPAHPYTAALLEARFDLHAAKEQQLTTLAGFPPGPGEVLPGCSFAPRCIMVMDACSLTRPPLIPVAQHSGEAACLRTSETRADIWSRDGQPWSATSEKQETWLLEMSGIHKTYHVRRRAFGRPEAIHAARGIDLTVSGGESVALVGESGSGKSTILRIVAGLVKPDRGALKLATSETPQMVFQDAAASLTPWLKITELVGERLRGRGMSRAERDQRVEEALELVGLSGHLVAATARQLSIGQCQRAAIARAVVIPPELLLCDEPVSAMDVSLAAGILNLLGSLRRRLGMALLFVTHDLAAARYIADRIVVLKGGEVVEEGQADEIIHRPTHPHTQELLASVPESLSGEWR